MKLHMLTVGKPKLAYATAGWEEYMARLSRLHTVRVTHISDKYAQEAARFHKATLGSYTVALDIQGTALSSEAVALFLQKRELDAKEVSFIIGGPTGLPQAVQQAADFQWTLGPLTLPHDLAMVVVLEALYRASSINIGSPYHK